MERDDLLDGAAMASARLAMLAELLCNAGGDWVPREDTMTAATSVCWDAVEAINALIDAFPED